MAVLVHMGIFNRSLPPPVTSSIKSLHVGAVVYSSELRLVSAFPPLGRPALPLEEWNALLDNGTDVAGDLKTPSTYLRTVGSRTSTVIFSIGPFFTTLVSSSLALTL